MINRPNRPFPFDLTIHRRSIGRRMFCWNAFFWGLGNGLVSTSLIIYVIIALATGSMSRAQLGLAIAWIIAAPRLIGILRLFTPLLIDAVGSRKRVTVVCYLLSPLILSILPASLPLLSNWSLTKINLVLGLVGLIWALYHLVEYFATVTLWSWMPEFLSTKIRPLFLARRERFMIAGQLIGRLAAGLCAYACYESFSAAGQTWKAYLLPACPGIFFLVVSALPILWIPETGQLRAERSQAERSPRISAAKRAVGRLREFAVLLRSKRFGLFLLFGCWIQLAGGLSQSAQSFFQMKILGVTILTTLLLESETRIGQTLLSGTVGRWIGRFGNPFVTGVSLLTVSTGSLCYALAAPSRWGLVIVASTIWIAWVGVNIGIGNQLLALSESKNRADYVALFFTMTTLAFGISTLSGGWLFDHFRDVRFAVPFRTEPVTWFQIVFVMSFVVRAAGILFLLPEFFLDRKQKLIRPQEK